MAALGTLPTELLQEIAWLSFNPNIYLVSRKFRSRLCSRREFVQDLALLLLCDRESSASAWYALPIPWSTGPAGSWDLCLTRKQREDLQRQVLDLTYITVQRLVTMIRFLLHSWVDIYFPFKSNLAPRQSKRLQTYLTSAGDACLRTDMATPVSCNKDHLVVDETRTNKLILSNDSGMSVSHGDEPYNRTKYVVHILYIPTRLLREEKETETDELSKTLLYRTKMDSLNHLIVKKHTATAKPRWMEEN